MLSRCAGATLARKVPRRSKGDPNPRFGKPKIHYGLPVGTWLRLRQILSIARKA